MKITTTAPRVEAHVLLDREPAVLGPYGPHKAEAQAVAFSVAFNGTKPVTVSVKALDPDDVERWRFVAWETLPDTVRHHLDAEVRQRLHRPDREAA